MVRLKKVVLFKKFINLLKKMQKLTTVDVVALVLLVVGGLNWGLVGLFQWNLVDALLGMWPMLARLVYVLVGLSAVYVAWLWMKLERK